MIGQGHSHHVGTMSQSFISFEGFPNTFTFVMFQKMSDLNIILQIWEYFAKLLPLEEYHVMDTFIQGIYQVGDELCQAQFICSCVYCYCQSNLC